MCKALVHGHNKEKKSILETLFISQRAVVFTGINEDTVTNKYHIMCS